MRQISLREFRTRGAKALGTALRDPEAVVGNLLKTPPVPRSDAKTGQPTTGKTIAPEPRS